VRLLLAVDPTLLSDSSARKDTRTLKGHPRTLGHPHRKVKEDRVRTGRAHAVLAIDENGVAQGWCQYGDPEELPNIKHKREYDKDPLRITCIFVDRKHRGQGIARAALEGALEQIARLGGGVVEAVSHAPARQG
jgi:GNAT superfamily N-acetyltransferase